MPVIDNYAAQAQVLTFMEYASPLVIDFLMASTADFTDVM